MTTITVRTQFEGVHRYPDAPEEVAYLREPHRHMFGVCVEVEVFDDDRELEFIMVKHSIDSFFANRVIHNCCVDLETASCEAVARMLLLHLAQVTKRSDERYWKITVDEDGENGASVEYRGAKQLPEYLKDGGAMGKLDGAEIHAGTKPWSLDEYQKAAYQNIQEHYNQKEEVMHWAIGLGEEAGEALSVIKHRYYAGCYKDDDDMLEDIVSELGDTLWHVSALCTVLGISLEDVARYNIAKLASRYPNGKFEKERSESRHEVYKQWKENDASHADVMEQIRDKRRK